MSTPQTPSVADPEDQKLVTLARATLARTRADSSCAARDTLGRTYAAAHLSLPHADVSAVAAVLAAAFSSGATGLEAVVLMQADYSTHDVAAIRDFAGAGVSLLKAAPSGVLAEETQTT